MEKNFDPRSVRFLVLIRGSELLREASVLVMVFGFLEKILDNAPVHFSYFVIIVLIGLLLFIIGLILERRSIQI